ncbi:MULTISPECIES: hypothetical protein [Prevotella]|uniref:Uncharacterized protein n=1 Tax=Prevotella herbatica TaxID=2801997 RepID=A0ABN6EKL3_9BACT|nr:MULTISPECIES: hypothetical protein [Prevotella]MDN5553142.1 hypothetical protein [Prevotella sp.]BCS85326.1 hypothetical protein prwr041_12190 [Prevotella herbatica]
MNKIIFILIAILAPAIGWSQNPIFDHINELNKLGDGVMHYSIYNYGQKQDLSYNYKNLSNEDINIIRHLMFGIEGNAKLSNHYECHEATIDTIAYRMLVQVDSLHSYAVSSEIVNHGAQGFIKVSQDRTLKSKTDTSKEEIINKLFEETIHKANIAGEEVSFDESKDFSRFKPEIGIGSCSSNRTGKGKLYIFPNEGNGFCEKFEKYLLDNLKSLDNPLMINIRKGIGQSINKNYKIVFQGSYRGNQRTPFYLAIVYKGKLRLLVGKGESIYIPAYWFMTKQEKTANNIE